MLAEADADSSPRASAEATRLRTSSGAAIFLLLRRPRWRSAREAGALLETRQIPGRTQSYPGRSGLGKPPPDHSPRPIRIDPAISPFSRDRSDRFGRLNRQLERNFRRVDS